MISGLEYLLVLHGIKPGDEDAKKVEDFDPSQWHNQSWHVQAAPSWLLANNLLGFKSQ
jgi:hypothetical protein